MKIVQVPSFSLQIFYHTSPSFPAYTPLTTDQSPSSSIESCPTWLQPSIPESHSPAFQSFILQRSAPHSFTSSFSSSTSQPTDYSIDLSPISQYLF